ncbi:hypothetical protein CsSME_00031341 [Camellia sinensis var. sinensis]
MLMCSVSFEFCLSTGLTGTQLIYLGTGKAFLVEGHRGCEWHIHKHYCPLHGLITSISQARFTFIAASMVMVASATTPVETASSSFPGPIPRKKMESQPSEMENKVFLVDEPLIIGSQHLLCLGIVVLQSEYSARLSMGQVCPKKGWPG